jgi:hypothetical protein
MTDQHRHRLENAGYNDLLAEHCELVDRVAGPTERLAAVEHMLADLHIPELVRELESLGCTVTVRIEPIRVQAEVMAELGGGWQIVRTPAGDADGATVERK